MKPEFVSGKFNTMRISRRTEVNDELNDLEDGNISLPPDANATSALEVVPVHDNMDHQVESNGHPGDGGETNELGVAEKSGGTVVVGVEEGQGLLLEEEEDCVDEFDILGEIVELLLLVPYTAFVCQPELT